MSHLIGADKLEFQIVCRLVNFPGRVKKWVQVVAVKHFVRIWQARTEVVVDHGFKYHGLEAADGREYSLTTVSSLDENGNKKSDLLASTFAQHLEIGDTIEKIQIDETELRAALRRIGDIADFLIDYAPHRKDLLFLSWPAAVKLKVEMEQRSEREMARLLYSELMAAAPRGTHVLCVCHPVDAAYPVTVKKLDSEAAFQLEGKRMHHCVADYWPSYSKTKDLEFWSLRDAQDNPILTMTIRLTESLEWPGYLSMIKGVCDVEPSAAQNRLILPLLRSMGVSTSAYVDDPDTPVCSWDDLCVSAKHLSVPFIERCKLNGIRQN